ncbi:AgrD family cyclic lactone autoinducer peptide [Lachnoclostridium phytofermentans]|nr:cyclic lactone autoinducer peptide [Lachnoclostridium phytofermentans]
MTKLLLLAVTAFVAIAEATSVYPCLIWILGQDEMPEELIE